MPAPKTRQTIEQVKQAAKVEQNYVVFASAPWWEIPEHIAVKLKIGVNWIGADPPTLYVKHQNGLVLFIGWTLPAPPRADIEREARRLLEERVAENQRRAKRSRLLRLELADPDTLTLDELRELCVSKGVDVEAIQNRVREKVERETSHPEPGPDAGDSKEPE